MGRRYRLLHDAVTNRTVVTRIVSSRFQVEIESEACLENFETDRFQLNLKLASRLQ